MPWKDVRPVDQRIAFIADWLSGEWSVTALAQRYSVSRKTAHKWVARYAVEGAGGLVERSRAPHLHGRACEAAVRAAVLALRRRYPRWGPRKLHAHLVRSQPDTTWPAPSTMGLWLAAAALTVSRPRRRTVVPLTQPLAAAIQPNAVWTADFKGWFRTADHTRCDPLTITDAYSRYALCCQIVPPTGAGVRPWFERTFREYGLPRVLRTDNGSPFATTGAGRLSRLAVWWLKLGLVVERIDPGAPQQNGRHERFHLTLQQEAADPPAATPALQQARFDAVRTEYNEVRPHEALGQEPPARHYSASPRPYPTRVDDPWYDPTHQVRRVKSNGQIRWRGDHIFISEAVRSEVVGLAETERGDWVVRFMDLELGRIDRTTRHFRPTWHGARVGGRVSPL